MSEFQPQAESKFVPTVPITELVEDISEYDADLMTRIAALDHRLNGVSDELSNMMPWALDLAYMHPHETAQRLHKTDTGLGTLGTKALQLAYETQRSDIAHRVSGNPKLPWMARVTDQTYAILREDRVYRDRKDTYSREPNAPWLYRKMQSRLLVCLAWMVEGKPMEVRRINPSTRQRIANEAMQFLEEESDGI